MTRLLRRHWILAVLLAAGITLRVLVWLAYQPALLYIDSFRYLDNLAELRPTDINPLGYPVVLKMLLTFGGFSFVSAVQHAVGVLLAIVLYALTLRYTSRTWAAAIVAAPVLLDSYQLQIEAMLMSEIWFQALLVGILWVLLSRGEPSWQRAALAGVLIAAATVTRTIGFTFIVPMACYLILAGGAWRSRAGWKRIAKRSGAGALGVLIALGSYAVYFYSIAGYWGITGAQGGVLYGRTASIADCSVLPAEDEALQRFCPPEPLDERKSIDFYTHSRYGNPDWPPGALPPDRTKEELADQFAFRIVREQPVDFTVAVLRDFAKNFAPVKRTSPKDVPAGRWRFQASYPYYNVGAETIEKYNARTMAYDGVLPSANADLASFLRSYQLGGGYTWGPLLAIAGLLGTAASLGIGKARRSGLRSATFLTTAGGLVILLGSAMFEFSWRYQLPTLVLLPLGGVLGLTALLGWGRRHPAANRRKSALDDFPDRVDQAALTDFRQRYGAAPLAPLVIVIAAYNEAEGIEPALRNIPDRCGELPVSTLVVVDGATDDTADAAKRAGAYVCVAPQNRGQGGALRLGYHLAASAGARYIVTTDADGQYDNDELPFLIKPLVDGTADFVTGSRRLGSYQYDSRVRWLGVRVFAVLASILTLRRITDTSFGFRGMTAELATSVTLREPQYQASELLLGALARKARFREVPMTMRLRNNGGSKKGGSVFYGANYARVMLGTWMREYVLGGSRGKPADRVRETS